MHCPTTPFELFYVKNSNSYIIMLYMFLSDGDFLKECIKKNHQKTYKQYTPIYMDTPFLISLGLLFLVYFWSTKKTFFVAVNKIGTRPLANASISIFGWVKYVLNSPIMASNFGFETSPNYSMLIDSSTKDRKALM